MNFKNGSAETSLVQLGYITVDMHSTDVPDLDNQREI
jgi:hypothetical protein